MAKLVQKPSQQLVVQSKRSATFTNKSQEAVKRIPFQYNHPWVFDRNGMKNPYMRPDRRVRVGHTKWWFHGYVPVYGRVIRRLAASELLLVRPMFYEWQAKHTHNLAKYGPVVMFGGLFVYGYSQLSIYWTEQAWKQTRF